MRTKLILDFESYEDAEKARKFLEEKADAKSRVIEECYEGVRI